MAALVYSKTKLSGAPGGGRLIKITATATPGTIIHSCSPITGNDWDELWVWAVNRDTVARKVTFEWGATSAPDDQVELVLEPEGGLVRIFPGWVLQDSLVLRAFAAAADVIGIGGYVNQLRNV